MTRYEIYRIKIEPVIKQIGEGLRLFNSPESGAAIAHIDPCGVVTDIYSGNSLRILLAYLAAFKMLALERNIPIDKILAEVELQIDGYGKIDPTIQVSEQIIPPEENLNVCLHEQIPKQEISSNYVETQYAVICLLLKLTRPDEAWIYSYSKVQNTVNVYFVGSDEKLITALIAGLHRFLTNTHKCPICGNESRLTCFQMHLREYMFQ